MFQNYSDEARRVIFFARWETSQFGNNAIDTKHIFLGLIRERDHDGVPSKLSALFLKLIPRHEGECLIAAVEETIARGEPVSTSVDLPLTESAKEVLANVETVAHQHGHREIRPVHILAALIEVDSELAEILSQHGVKRDAVFAFFHYEIPLILAAAAYAAEKHSGQKRKGEAGEPYINHLIEVAQLVSSVAPDDPNLVAAALLHDVIEDTSVSAIDLHRRFAQDVTFLVQEVTDDKSLPKEERKRLQVERAAKISARAQIIKLADKISNLRSILTSPPLSWDYERKKQYFEWAKQVVDALSSPNPVLKAEFEKTYRRFDEIRP